MTTTFLLRIFLPFVFCCGLSHAGDFKPLFNGINLEDFTIENGTAAYRIEDGAIVGRTVPKSPNTFLSTKKIYGDFELTFEVKVDGALNSGVQIRSRNRTTAEGRHKEGRYFGPQVEIEASPGEAGYVYGEAMGGGWLSDPIPSHSHFKNEAWNQYRILAKGAGITTWINGEKITETVREDAYETHPDGHIGFQVHSTSKKKLAGKEFLEVRWRKLMIREF